MGISGLLPLLKSISRTVHVGIYSGKTVAIDAYSWLHKGAYSCSLDLVTGNMTDNYITYCMNKINLLLHHNIKPIMVFDGGMLPSKLETEHKRKEMRDTFKKKTMELLHRGNNQDAFLMSHKCVEITTSIAHRLIEELQRNNVQFIVAPYEADAQMAYLDKIGMVDAVISEDSDLLLFGCRRILFKLDRYGNAEEICLNEVFGAETFDFPGMTHDQFRQICILSGCDYLGSLPGIGIKTAIKLLKKHVTIDNLMRSLRLSCKEFSSDYESRFYRAELTFKHQRVYDPIQQCLRYLNEPERVEMCNGVLSPNAFIDDWDDYFGPSFDDDTARAVACGLLDPITHDKISALTFDSLPFNHKLSGTVGEKFSISNDSCFGEDFVVPETPKSKRIRHVSKCSPSKFTLRSSPKKSPSRIDSVTRVSPRKLSIRNESLYVLQKSSEIIDVDKEIETASDATITPQKRQQNITFFSSSEKIVKTTSISQIFENNISLSAHSSENSQNVPQSPKKVMPKKSPYFTRLSSKGKFIGTKKQAKLQQYFSQ